MRQTWPHRRAEAIERGTCRTHKKLWVKSAVRLVLEFNNTSNDAPPLGHEMWPGRMRGARAAPGAPPPPGGCFLTHMTVTVTERSLPHSRFAAFGPF